MRQSVKEMRDEAGTIRSSRSVKESKVRKPSSAEKLGLIDNASSIVRSLSARITPKNNSDKNISINNGPQSQPQSQSPSPLRLREPPKIVETKSASNLNLKETRSHSGSRDKVTVKAKPKLSLTDQMSPVEIVLMQDNVPHHRHINDSSGAISDQGACGVEDLNDSSSLPSRSQSFRISKSTNSFGEEDVDGDGDGDPAGGSNSLTPPKEGGVFYSALSIANRCNRTSSTRSVRLNSERLPRSAGTFASHKTLTKSGFLSPPNVNNLDHPVRSASIGDCTRRSPTIEFLPIYSELRRDKRLGDEVEGAWRRFDVDGDGSISMRELASVMTQLGQTPCEDQLRQMIEQVDEDGDGRIGWQEFSKMMDSQFDELDKQERKMRRAFEYFDLKKDQFIDKDELHTVLNRLGDSLSLEEAEEMIRAADSDNDGRVSYSEFVAMMSAHLAHALGE